MTTITKAWGAAVISFANHLRAAGRPETTIYLRTYHVRRLATEAGRSSPWEVTADDLSEWTGSQRWSRETRRSVRSSMRSFYGWARATGRTDDDPSVGLAPVKPTEPVPRPAPEAAYRAALAEAGPRERLMLRLSAELGMRRGEVARVHARDLMRDLTGWSLLVHGKGDKLRIVPMTDGLAAALRAQCADGWAFPSSRGGHLTPAHVSRLVGRLLPQGVTMHALRHRFGTRAYAVDRDLLTVQRLLGHASPQTTLRYVMLPDDGLRRTVAAVAA